MKKRAQLIIMLFCALMIQNSFAQSKFGNVTMDEMNMTSYQGDTTAVAVMLLKKGNVKFKISPVTGGFQFEYEIEAKIKILKSEGLNWCNHEIAYRDFSRDYREEIRGLSGTTYNLENGKIEKTKLSKEYIFDEDINEDLKIKKFTLPAAKVGSVIEYKYTLVSDFLHNLREFTFQSSIPIEYTSFDIVTPEYFTYSTNTQGYIRLETKQEPTNASYHLGGQTLRCGAERTLLIGRNVPAIKDEAFLWTIDDYVSKISFELKRIYVAGLLNKNYTTSWNVIDEELLGSEYFGGNLKKAGLFKDEISKTEINIERATEIQNLVKDKVKWNDKYGIYASDLKKTFKEGTGSSADANFLLINALKAGGFDAFPVILSLRSHGRIPVTNPTISAFNYVITGMRIDTLTYFTDAAAKFGDWNILPEDCLVPQARIVAQNNSHWVDLTTIAKGAILKAATIQFTDSKYQAKVSDDRRGVAAYNLRKSYHGHKDQNEYVESLAKNHSCEIDSFTVSNMDNTASAVKMSYIMEKPGINSEDEYLYINPMIDNLFTENPFKAETREYPINFDYYLNYMQVVNIHIPQGYAVEEMPQSEKIVLGDNNEVSLLYQIAQRGNLISMRYQFITKSLLLLPKDYEHVQDFFARLVLKNSEQVVLKKVAAAN